VLGFALLGAGLSAATYGASQGPASGCLSARSAPAWLGGLLLMAGYAAAALAAAAMAAAGDPRAPVSR
jgi:hypothetical protein